MMALQKTTYDQYVNEIELKGAVIVHETVAADISLPGAIEALEAHHATLSALDFYTNQECHYSFIGLTPLKSLIVNQDDSVTDPFQCIRTLAAHYKAQFFHPDARLTAAPVGVLAYDAVRYIEKFATPAKKKVTPDLEINFFEYGIYFNYREKMVTLSKYVKTSTASKDNYNAAMSDLGALIKCIFAENPARNSSRAANKANFSVDLTDEQFAAEVIKAKSFIQKGEVFQLVLSRAYRKEFSTPPVKLYKTLIETSNAPFYFYIKNPRYTLVAASPEKIISVKDRVITSTPLAGTKPVEKNIDATLQTLLTDEKELAEHMMLVDLARNDIGRASIPGSVKVTKLTYPLILKNIIHIASDVQGILEPHLDSIDALTASFPAGTLTGAPKIRAMQLIEELESNNRDFYGGCVIALDQQDNLDTCIIIRCAHCSENKITIRAGCGIVYNSDPLAEARETELKASTLLNTISICERGIES